MSVWQDHLIETALHMDRKRRRKLRKAAALIGKTAGISRGELAEMLARAQPGSPFTPEFEAALMVIRGPDGTGT